MTILEAIHRYAETSTAVIVPKLYLPGAIF